MAAAAKAAENGECPYRLLVNGYGPVDMACDLKAVTDKDEYWLDPAMRGPAFMDLPTDGDEEFGRRPASLGVEVTMRRFLGAAHGFIPHFMDHWREGAELIARSIRNASL